MTPDPTGAIDEAGSQRLSLDHLGQWESLKFGMFIHFGMSTFDGQELSKGDLHAAAYAPDKLDVDQWTGIARDAGMKYAVLTTKHVAGFCLWPSDHTDYHVGTSANATDVVDAFVKSCEKRGILPGLYYCSWDNHHRFGSFTPTDSAPFEKPLNRGNPMDSGGVQLSFTTRRYEEFQTKQIEELMGRYGRLGEVWIDVPSVLTRSYRVELYNRVAELQPQAVIMMNSGIGDGSSYPIEKSWPSDLVAIERFLPNSQTGHVKWREIEGRKYYMPGEVCDPIGSDWFFVEGDEPRSDAELLGMYLSSVSRGTNLLLDVGPNKHGLVPEKMEAALRRLRRNLDLLGM